MRLRKLVCLVLSIFSLQGFAVVASEHSTAALNTSAHISNEELLQSDACKVALAPHDGDDKLDDDIRQTQSRVRSAKDPLPQLERLGWQYVAKSRASYDPGYMSLAEQCALAMELAAPDAPQALILHGHVLHSMHRFHEAEEVARKVVKLRGAGFDYALLGDALMEQGELGDAESAYQIMLDKKPCLQTYSRAAHLSWLQGDLDQARELMRLAARAVSLRDAEPGAWAYSRLAAYELQAGELERAAQCCRAALDLQPRYAPALMVKTRLLLSQNQPKEALLCIQTAEHENPLPEYQWMLADVLNLNGKSAEAQQIEAALLKRGPISDNRTTALFLATRNKEPELALRLANTELQTRQDVFTHDAAAWANFNSGHMDEARRQSAAALAEETQDARLFLHAGIIAAAADAHDDASKWLDKSFALKQMLFPSEQTRLFQERERLNQKATQTSQEEVSR